MRAGSATVAVTQVTATYGADLEQSALPLAVAIAGAASDGDSVVLGTAEGAVAYAGGDPTGLAVYTEDPAGPWATGAVRALTEREGGVLVAGEAGLFHTMDGYLLPSPASVAVAGLTVTAMDDAGSGDAEEVWLGTAEGLHRLTGGVLTSVSFPGETGTPQAVGILPDAALAAFGPRVYELRLADWSYLVTTELGTVHQIATSGGEAWLASDTGAAHRDAPGHYTRYALAEGAAQGVTVHAGYGAYLVTTQGVLRAEGGTLVGVSSLASQATTRPLAMSDAGQLVVGDGSDATTVYVESPPSFATEVAPIFEARCASCHAEGAGGVPKRDFTDYEQVVAISSTILVRMGTGLMPPATAPQLTQGELDTVLTWFATGSHE